MFVEAPAHRAFLKLRQERHIELSGTRSRSLAGQLDDMAAAALNLDARDARAVAFEGHYGFSAPCWRGGRRSRGGSQGPEGP